MVGGLLLHIAPLQHLDRFNRIHTVAGDPCRCAGLLRIDHHLAFAREQPTFADDRIFGSDQCRQIVADAVVALLDLIQIFTPL